MYKFGTLLHNCWGILPTNLRSHALISLASCGLSTSQNNSGLGPLYVVGFFRAPTGLGQSARLYYHEAASDQKCPLAIDLTDALLQPQMVGLWSAPTLTPHECSAHLGPGTVVIHINPPIFLLALRLLRPFLDGKRIIAYWAWELMDIPPFWRRCLPYVDAIEAPSTFSAAAIARSTHASVSVHPHVVPHVTPSSRQLAADGIIRILTIFDMASNFYRKNPLASVQAFKLAFGHNPHAQLYLKVSGLNRYPAGREALRNAISGWDTIRLYEERLSEHGLAELYRHCDIVLSLHCAEGYGLTIREAMEYGLHVVATGWSGNMDFMQRPKCHVVPYRMKPVIDHQKAYPAKKKCWAVADVISAAASLQDIVSQERPDLGLSLPPLERPSLFRFSPADVTAVIVNYREWRETLACLASLYRLSQPPRRIVVVDNGSGTTVVRKLLDGWSTLCRKKQPIPSMQIPPLNDDGSAAVLLSLPHNVGFAAANNTAVRFLDADPLCHAYWFLNSDTLPQKDALEELCKTFSMRPDAGMAGSLLVDMEHPNIVQCAGGGRLSSLTGLTKNLWQGENTSFVASLLPESVEASLTFLCGASLMVRRDAWTAAGGMDERYFLYYEDVDLSLRMRRAQKQLIFAPKSVVRHRGGGSCAKDAPLVDYFSIRNRLMLVRFFFPLQLPIALVWQVAAMGKAFFYGQYKRLPLMASAIKDSFSSRLHMPGSTTENE